ncbi:MAG: enoyl-CoA hydratase-related protein [Acidimicrobiaceae bacterium]|nr:enoyl-CoA hydratase-related protein [Acidimicrobiaceae bacterium]
MRQLVETCKSQGVLTITLADEKNRNVLSAGLVSELLSAINAADADPDIRVVVLTNHGSVFCAGADLTAGSASGQSGQSGQSAPTAVELFSRFAKSPKPFVGRINGHCVAGGMGLAAAMDISVALDSAKMGFTEVRLGLAPAMVSVLCLPKMRLAQASEAFLRGKRFLAPEAVSMGIINHAVSADRIDAVTDRIVADLLLGGQNALAVCKQLTQRMPAMTTEDAFEWTSKISAQLFASEDGQEGIRAFTEKRAPSWAPRPG